MIQVQKFNRICSSKTLLSTFLVQLFERFCCLYVPPHITIRQCLRSHTIPHQTTHQWQLQSPPRPHDRIVHQQEVCCLPRGKRAFCARWRRRRLRTCNLLFYLFLNFAQFIVQHCYKGLLKILKFNHIVSCNLCCFSA